MVTDVEAIHEEVLRKVLGAASNMDLHRSPPEMVRCVHRKVRQITGVIDPYCEQKRRFNRLGEKLYPSLRNRINFSVKSLEMAMRIAIAGNIIDCGVDGEIEDSSVAQAIDQSLIQPLEGRLVEFSAAISQANDILYLADNAGEIFFDRLLIEQMPLEKVTVVVKGLPILNDATIRDAEAAGLTSLVEVIDNGSDAPGTILAECSASFKERFEKADLVVAKGQGNYESLSDVEKDIFFILKAKCPVIAEHLGCEVGTMVLRRSEPTLVSVKGGEFDASR